MELLIIRHGDPDYSIDSLTEKGWREAELLSNKLEKIDISEIYCSPLGRAKDTASLTLKRKGMQMQVVDWLAEIGDGCRDFLPSYWTGIEEYYSKDDWYKPELMHATGAKEICKRAAQGLDEVLAKHGYIRDNRIYRVEKESHEKVALFCHYGISGALLSHLTGVSPVIYWQHFVAAPTSVTRVVTEERRKGIATFRVMAYGDTGHLYAGGEEPAFAARFCECFSDDTRHD